MECTQQSHRERQDNFRHGGERQITLLTSMEFPTNSMVNYQDSSHANEKLRKVFESLAMMLGERVREYVARAKGLVNAVRYHGVKVTEEDICRRILNGVFP